MRDGQASPCPVSWDEDNIIMPALGSGIKDSRKSARPEILQIL